MEFILRFLMCIMAVLCIILFCAIIFQEPSPKLSEYKPQNTSTVKKEEEDCTYTMCNAFGGGIAGDTLAIQFMNGD